MAVQITIVGLGQIGASMGLALAAHKDQVTTVGHDKSAETAQRAKKLGAVDKVEFNLPHAVAKADVVVLALPTDQIYETIRIVAQDLREDAVLMETSPAKALVSAWAGELLPPKRHYVGLTPALSPLYVEAAGTGVEAAHADLFDHGMMGISAPPGTSGDALQLAASLATLLGAVPYFADQVEIDGVMASAHLLPELAGAALANFLIGQPGWSDIRKMAGRPFTAATACLTAGELAGLGAAAANDRQNLVRLLDGLGASLKELREAIAAGDDQGLLARLGQAGEGRAAWWTERARGDWNAVERGKVELPRARDILKQQIGGLDKLFRRGDRRDEE
jgi:prephenate dehydrogenase